MGPLAGDRFTEIEVTSAQQLWEWLEQHHQQTDGIWLITYKKAAAQKHLTHNDVLDALVAYGWCDGGARRIDDQRTMQQISPRRTQPWAKSYKDRAERLLGQGTMQPSGQRSIDHAKACGMWNAMNDVDDLIVPDDLTAALQSLPDAGGYFAAFPPSTRRNMLRWIASARTQQTRQRRIDQIAKNAQHNIRTKTNG